MNATNEKLAKDIQAGEVVIEGKHRMLILEIVGTNDKTITYKFKVVSVASRGFGNVGTEYKRLTTKVRLDPGHKPGVIL